MARAGLDMEFQEVSPGRRNVVARLCAAGQLKRRIILAPHMDTVGGAVEEVFRPRIKGDRLYGRGACDTKGSIAAMAAALEDLLRSERRPRETEIIFIGLVDEEHAQAGSRALAASGLLADLAIVGEPTRCRVVTAHKGSVWLKLMARGQAAHGAKPELGVNAVHTMARVVTLLETDYARSLRRGRHPLLGHPTVNVGTIAGGLQPNIVPDRCVIDIDRRTLPGETEAGVRREIAALLHDRDLAVLMTATKLSPCPALETDPRSPLVRQFMRHARQTQPAGVDFFCDAAVLAAAGIPAVVFGPGDIAQAHTRDEWVSLKSLERAKDILVNFLSSLP